MVLPTVATEAEAEAGAGAGSRAGGVAEDAGGARRGKGVRTALGVTCGALWWLAVLRFGLPRPGASGGPAGGLHAAIVAGGWSLGLIPMHAVPVRRRAKPPTAPAAAGHGPPGGQPPGGADPVSGL
jgi:hypothetical protein